MQDEAYRIMAEMDETYWWFRARREILRDVVARFVPENGEITDYGGGSGALASRLRDDGYRVAVAELNREMLETCRARGVPTIDLNIGGPAPSSADCLLACDVLEHVPDDVGLLEELKRVLRPDGLFIATVPAYEFLWSGEDHVSRHFRRYTRPALAASLGAAGYDVIWSSHFNTLLFPPIAAVILAKRLFRPRDMYRSNVRPLPGWIDAVLVAVFSSERELLRKVRLPVGLSIVCVARPRAPASRPGPVTSGHAAARPASG